MGWIYLVELGESHVLWGNGSIQSLIVREIDTLPASFFQECQKDCSTGLLSGMMSLLCVNNNSQQDMLTSYLGDFPVKISVLQEMGRVWKESEVGFSSKLSDLQKSYARRLCSSKTSQQLELGDFERLSEHLPISGMTVDGLVYLPLKLEPRTLGKDGSYLPTPTAQDFKKRGPNSKQQGLSNWVLWPTPMASDYKAGWGPGDQLRSSPRLQTKVGGKLNPQWVEWLMGYPTEWTELNALGMQWFQSKSRQRSKNS